MAVYVFCITKYLVPQQFFFFTNCPKYFEQTFFFLVNDFGFALIMSNEMQPLSPAIGQCFIKGPLHISHLSNCVKISLVISAFTPFYMAFHLVGICVCLFGWLLEQPKGLFERRPTGQLPPLPHNPFPCVVSHVLAFRHHIPRRHRTPNFPCWQAICTGHTDAGPVQVNVFNIGQGEDNF